MNQVQFPPTDAMSEVLSLTEMRGELLCVGEYSGDWSLRLIRQTSHFHVVLSGNGYLIHDNQPPVLLSTGDLVILPKGGGHILTSDPKLVPVSIDESVKLHKNSEGIHQLGDGNDPSRWVCGRFSFRGALGAKLLAIFPPVIHVPGNHGQPPEWLRLTTDFLIDETRNPRPGSAIMVHRLLDLLFIQAIRDWGRRSENSLGWLGGLQDPMIGRVLTAIHSDPSHVWTVSQLADLASMSRSTFASRFSKVVGQTPLKYIASWRLDLAANQLRSGRFTISEIALSVGYASESALTRAFKAQFGTTPSAYRIDGPKLPA